MPLVVYEDHPAVDLDTPDGREALTLATGELAATTGWELKPEGICRGDTCVPLPPGREHELLSGGRLDLVALARLLGQPVVHDADANAWAFGHTPPPEPLPGSPVEAPEFALPDIDGTTRRLSDLRGIKVLLLSWASW